MFKICNTFLAYWRNLLLTILTFISNLIQVWFRWQYDILRSAMPFASHFESYNACSGTELGWDLLLRIAYILQNIFESCLPEFTNSYA